VIGGFEIAAFAQTGDCGRVAEQVDTILEKN